MTETQTTKQRKHRKPHEIAVDVLSDARNAEAIVNALDREILGILKAKIDRRIVREGAPE